MTNSFDRPIGRRLFRICLLFSMTALPVAVHAQTPGDATPAPARHVRETPRQTMTLTVGLSGGSSEERGDVDPSQTPGPVTDADATLTYHHRGKRTTFDLSGQSVVRGTQTDVTPMRQQGTFDFAATGTRQQFHATQSASYAPSYQFGAMPGPALTPEADTAQAHGDFANADVNALTSSTGLGWNRMLGSRFALTASYNLRRTMFDQSHADLDMTSQDAGAGLSRRMTRYVSLHGAYTYRVADSPSMGGRVRVNDIDAGVDFSRPLTVSKRTTLSFATGSSMVPDVQGMAFRVTGNAALNRLFGRTWNLRLGVNRAVRLVEGFTEPLMENSIATALAGNLLRHVSWSTSGSLSTGTVGLEQRTQNSYSNWTAASGLNFELGRHALFNVHYFIANDQFDRGVALPPGVVNERLRQGVRAGFTLRAPFMGY
jgi:hypothetical protein